jgi:hypothetical protein
LSAALALRTNDKPGIAVSAALPAAALAPRRNLRRLLVLRVADAPRFATVSPPGVRACVVRMRMDNGSIVDYASIAFDAVSTQRHRSRELPSTRKPFDTRDNA